MLKKEKGVGIINIKTRAELYDGRVAVISNPGKGYELKIELSLNGHMNKPEILKKMSA